MLVAFFATRVGRLTHTPTLSFAKNAKFRMGHLARQYIDPSLNAQDDSAQHNPLRFGGWPILVAFFATRVGPLTNVPTLNFAKGAKFRMGHPGFRPTLFWPAVAHSSRFLA
jgi:hypothetical protein